jgi:hypothetical protein
MIYKIVEGSEQERKELNDAIWLLAKAGIEIDIDIQIAEFQRKNLMGCYHDGKIMISPKNFDRGDHYLLNTLIEEYIHWKHQVKDETREFQDSSINLIVKMIKKYVQPYNSKEPWETEK